MGKVIEDEKVLHRVTTKRWCKGTFVKPFDWLVGYLNSIFHCSFCKVLQEITTVPMEARDKRKIFLMDYFKI